MQAENVIKLFVADIAPFVFVCILILTDQATRLMPALFTLTQFTFCQVGVVDILTTLGGLYQLLFNIKYNCNNDSKSLSPVFYSMFTQFSSCAKS